MKNREHSCATAVPVFHRTGARTRVSHGGRFRLSCAEDGSWQLYDTTTQSLTRHATLRIAREVIALWMSRARHRGERFDVVPTWFGTAVLLDRLSGRYWHHPGVTSARRAATDLVELESHLTTPDFIRP